MEVTEIQLLKAIQSRDAGVVQKLLQQGVSPNISYGHKNTALMYAVMENSVSIANMLLDCGADPNVDSSDCGTALHIAAQNGSNDFVKMLVSKGADVDKATRSSKHWSGGTPLMSAVLSGQTSCVQLLLSLGANPLAADDDGLTAWYAVKNNRYPDIKRLLEPYQNDGWTGLGKLVAKGLNNAWRVAEGFTGELTNPSGLKNSSGTSNEPANADPQALSLLLDDLTDLVGLSVVKADISKHISLLRVQKLRRDKGLSVPEQSLHMVFSGNPGTGKTSVARLIAKIYKQMGILSKGQFIETDRSGLVAEYVGQTAPKVQSVVKKAIGGVLFIDEAYTLSGIGRGGDQFGQEAIDTLLKLMEDHRNDLIVIVAGYTEPMQRFIQSNPGLQSRFNKYLHFEDYSPDDLTSIFIRLAKQHDYKLTPPAQAKVTSVFQQHYKSRTQTFGNARLARNLFESAVSDHAMRIGNLHDVGEDDLVTLVAEDINQ